MMVYFWVWLVGVFFMIEHSWRSVNSPGGPLFTSSHGGIIVTCIHSKYSVSFKFDARL